MLKKWRRFFRYYIQITYCYCFYRNEVIYYWMILIAIFLDTVVICRWMWNQNIFQEFGASSQWTSQLAVLRECLVPLRCSLLIIHHFTFVMSGHLFIFSQTFPFISLPSYPYESDHNYVFIFFWMFPFNSLLSYSYYESDQFIFSQTLPFKSLPSNSYYESDHMCSSSLGCSLLIPYHFIFIMRVAILLN